MEQLKLLGVDLETYCMWLMISAAVGGFLCRPVINAVKTFYNEYPQTVFVFQCLFLFMMLTMALSIPINEIGNSVIEPKAGSTLFSLVSDLIQNLIALVGGVMLFLLDSVILIVVVLAFTKLTMTLLSKPHSYEIFIDWLKG
ncbi:TPA: hypothetical protein ACN35C_004741 [Vibrio parahaemolyticus]